MRSYLPKITLKSLPYLFSSNATILPSKPRRFAIFSASIHSTLRCYLFYTPIVAAAWQRFGYEPIVVLVGDWTNTSSPALQAQLNLTETFLQRLNVHSIRFQCNRTYEVKIAQLVRIFGGYLLPTIIKDDDYILTTDSDLIPLMSEDYELRENISGVIFNACCGGFFERRNKSYRMYSMSHICLRKRIWRDLFLQSIQHKELLNSTANRTLLSLNVTLSFEIISLYARQEFLDLYDSNMIKGDAAWYMDQMYVSMLLHEYAKKTPQIRIGKQMWQRFRLNPQFSELEWQPQKIKQYGDVHLVHDQIFQAYRWKLFQNLLGILFQPTLINEIEQYYQKFNSTLTVQSNEY